MVMWRRSLGLAANRRRSECRGSKSTFVGGAISRAQLAVLAVLAMLAAHMLHGIRSYLWLSLFF